MKGKIKTCVQWVKAGPWIFLLVVWAGSYLYSLIPKCWVRGPAAVTLVVVSLFALILNLIYSGRHIRRIVEKED